MDYLVGDVQGCGQALTQLVEEIGFSPSRDRLFMLGDLINRGPSSLSVLRRLHGYGDAARCLLGNHDLHLLAVAHGVRALHPGDTFDQILDADDCDAWLDWLRTRNLAIAHDGWLMVHAGVVPQWDVAQTLGLAAEVEAQLAGPRPRDLLAGMYGNEPDRWRDDLRGIERSRFVINALTRMRFCGRDGRVDFKRKDGPKSAASAGPDDMLPWFDVPGRKTASTPIACGHWSTLGLVNRPDLLAIDTGCVWGGALTAVRVDGGRRDVVQVKCEQAAKHGG